MKRRSRRWLTFVLLGLGAASVVVTQAWCPFGDSYLQTFVVLPEQRPEDRIDVFVREECGEPVRVTLFAHCCGRIHIDPDTLRAWKQRADERAAPLGPLAPGMLVDGLLGAEWQAAHRGAAEAFTDLIKDCAARGHAALALGGEAEPDALTFPGVADFRRVFKTPGRAVYPRAAALIGLAVAAVLLVAALAAWPRRRQGATPPPPTA